jgi:hypothetical protein
MRLAYVAALCLTAAACGPTSTEEDIDGGGPGADDGSVTQQDAYVEPPSAHVKGIVYAPNGRTFTPPLTVSGALVYLSDFAPEPIPQQAFCERCTEIPSGAHFVRTDPSGAFDLNVWDGSYVMVIQKGQFRLTREIFVGKGQTLEIPPDDSTLPSRNSGDGNDTIPRMALLSGSYDPLEDLLAKFGFAGLASGGTEVDWNVQVAFDIYDNAGTLPPSGSAAYANYKGTALELLTNYELLKTYHIVFVPCSYTNDEVVTNASVQANLKQYVKEGGKVYVADYSYDYMRQTWDMVRFRNDGTPPSPGSGNGGPMYDSQGHAVDEDLFKWLEAQQVGWGGDNLVLRENWDIITNLVEGYIGDDPENGPQYAKPNVIVEGPHEETIKWNAPNAVNLPLTVGFPYGCGRVLYTTYHTVGEMSGPHAGIEVQERILVYLIMELGVCQTGPILE